MQRVTQIKACVSLEKRSESGKETTSALSRLLKESFISQMNDSLAKHVSRRMRRSGGRHANRMFASALSGASFEWQEPRK